MAEGGYDPRPRNNDSRSLQVCRFYLMNSCNKGDRCVFRHVRNAETQENALICKYYHLGCCRYGKNCKFTHVKPEKSRGNSQTHVSSQPVENGWDSRTNVREFPSRMITLKRNGTDKISKESDSNIQKNKKDQKWAQAQDFVPGKKFHGSVPSSYASAVQPNNTSFVSDLPPLIKEEYLLCPYFEHSGHCPFESKCEYAHAFICDFCGLPKLHPIDKELREKHVKECIADHEKQMERAFAVQASIDKECGICLESVMDKDYSSSSGSDKRFGILENCNHCFCLSCIRTWRTNKSDVILTKRTCPTCRTHSDFVTPSKFWVESPKAKRKLIDDYKNAMNTKPCQYFLQGKGECPFDNRCFYKHALEDGSIVHENVIRRRRRMNADGERTLEDEYSLWDYITRREEDGQILPLDAQLSLVLLGIFQDSDDEDGNNSFALRYNFLDGDFVFTDSDEEDTDSDS